jgi:Flp pilus assembly protein TadD
VVQGIALQQSGKLPEAEAALRKATELDASRADAWYALGSVLQQLGNDDASQAFSKAVELKPDDPNARLRLAAVLAKKDPVKAKKNVEILMYNPAANKVQLKAAKRMDAVIRAENGNVLTTNP